MTKNSYEAEMPPDLKNAEIYIIFEKPLKPTTTKASTPISIALSGIFREITESIK